MKPRQAIFSKACLGTILVFVFLNYFETVSAQNIKMYQKGIAFYASGRVKSGYLARNQKIQEWLFQGGTQEQPGYLSGEESEVEFFENGRVKKGYLAETVRIGRKTYDREGRIEFDDSGRVVAFDI